MKKDIAKLVPIKKPVYNPKAGKTIDITYYVKPKTSKVSRKEKKKQEEIKNQTIEDFINNVKETPYGEQIAKTFLCNL